MSEVENREEGASAPPRAKIISPKERSKLVPLEFPVEFDGKVWSEVEVTRINATELEEYIGAVRRGEARMPPTVRCPVEVWEAMDADDQDAVDEAAMDFTPRRLRAAVERIRGTGANTSDK